MHDDRIMSWDIRGRHLILYESTHALTRPRIAKFDVHVEVDGLHVEPRAGHYDDDAPASVAIIPWRALARLPNVQQMLDEIEAER